MHGEEIRDLFLRMGINPVTVINGRKQWISLDFNHDDAIISIIKRFNGRWSQRYNCWYVNRDKKLLQNLVREIGVLKGIETDRTEIIQVRKKIRLKGYSEETTRNYIYCLERWLEYIYPYFRCERKEGQNCSFVARFIKISQGLLYCLQA